MGKEKSLQEMFDHFLATELPRIEAFRTQLEKSVKLLREGKISPKDFCEGLIKEGDGKPVSLILFEKDVSEPNVLERTADGRLFIQSQQISWTIPNLKVYIGLDGKEQLVVKDVEAWFTNEETGKPDKVEGDTVYSDYNLEPISIRGLAEEVLQELLDLLPLEDK